MWRHNAKKQLVNGWSGLCLQMNPVGAATYTRFQDANCYQGHGGREIDRTGVVTGSLAKCEARCDADAACSCVVYQGSTGTCWKRAECVSAQFQPFPGYDVYVASSRAPGAGADRARTLRMQPRET